MYLENAEVGWIEATVVNETPSTYTIKIQSDDTEECPSQELPSVQTIEKPSVLFLENPPPTETQGIPDMISLTHLHEPAILFNLRHRFRRQLPYTYTGDICIAVNPYDWLDLYSKETQMLYLSQPKQELPPHIYATSATAYYHMRLHKQDQSILVSGESGAGKTETTKFLMSHLAIAGSQTEEKDAENATIQCVLDSNPLMESFGNAKTVRNDNSSRFGKFSEIEFNSSGEFVGAKCRTYLLEKSRVVEHSLGERNYHIFYQLLAAPSSFREKLCLHDKVPQSYSYLRSRQPSNSPKQRKAKPKPAMEPASVVNIHDSTHFERTLHSLQTFQTPTENTQGIFRVLAAILHLGNLEFEPCSSNEDQAILKSSSNIQLTFSWICCLLSVRDEVKFLDALRTRYVRIGHREEYSIPRTVSQIMTLVKAFAMTLYDRLFHFIVDRINKATSSACENTSEHSSELRRICILDIFGFENFVNNSFEQLCINYANETLQQQFTRDVFKTIEREYEEEGICWTGQDSSSMSGITYVDNEPVLRLIQGRYGILALLNEESVIPKGSDEGFANKLQVHFKDHDAITFDRLHRQKFCITHYAGAVEYVARGFVEKNNQSPYELEIDRLLELATNNCLEKQAASAEKCRPTSTRGRSTSILANTIASTFQVQLRKLMHDIQQTNVAYIRCIKPNSCQSPRFFSKKSVTLQLRYAGVVAAIEATRCSFPNKMDMAQFVCRFHMLQSHRKSVGERGLSHDVRARCSYLLDRYCSEAIDARDRENNQYYAMGKTKVYFGHGVLSFFEDRRTTRIHAAARLLQKQIRSFQRYQWYRHLRCATIRIQACIRRYQQQKTYLRSLRAIVMVQTYARGMISRARVRVIKRNLTATRVQAWTRMIFCRRKYHRWRKALSSLQLRYRQYSLREKERKARLQAIEDAKLENQIRHLKQMMQQQQQDHDNAHLERMEALSDANEVIAELKMKNRKLKTATRNLTAFNRQLREQNQVLQTHSDRSNAIQVGSNMSIRHLHNQLRGLESVVQAVRKEYAFLKEQNEQLLRRNQALKHDYENLENLRQAEATAYQEKLVQLQEENRRLQSENSQLQSSAATKVAIPDDSSWLSE